RLVSSEKDNGAMKLMLQGPAGLPTMLAAKGLILMAAWVIAWIPGFAALLLWKLYGGSVYAPELLNLLLGHLLRVILSTGVAVAAAAITIGAASGAIVTIGFTVGTWALDFVAAGRGGLLQTLGAYTPTAALRVFEQGQLRLSIVLVLLIAGIGGFAIAEVWLRPGRDRRARHRGSIVAGVAICAALWAGSLPRASWDLSENRRNSFSPFAEAALAKIGHPLRVTVFLAPEDPRLMDLDRGILSKLRRIVPRLDVDYAAHSRSGLFESGDHYGEVWYELDGRKVMSRSTTEPVVLDTLYKLAQIAPPAQPERNDYAGHPLPADPTGAAWIFYGLWPVVFVPLWWQRMRYI
ncbi:MAG TPA: hypothetical protein VIX89_07020, partial [Bryobacteraceae bacterium]